MDKTVLYDSPKVGRDALSYCGKCKMELAHVIVSMVDGKPARVQCKTCNSQHNHKRTGGAASILKKPSTPRAKKTVILVSELWEKTMQQRHAEEVKPYNVKESFAKNSLIEHPQFGVGVVQTIVSPSKILVLFRNAEILLAQGL
jgi:hypothetical protein